MDVFLGLVTLMFVGAIGLVYGAKVMNKCKADELVYEKQKSFREGFVRGYRQKQDDLNFLSLHNAGY